MSQEVLKSLLNLDKKLTVLLSLTYNGRIFLIMLTVGIGQYIVWHGHTVVPDLVMANIWPVAPCWLRTVKSRPFTSASELSIEANIQFTIEHTCQTDKGQSVSSLDSQITMLGDGSMFTEKQTIPTNFWILSHNPALTVKDASNRLCCYHWLSESPPTIDQLSTNILVGWEYLNNLIRIPYVYYAYHMFVEWRIWRNLE